MKHAVDKLKSTNVPNVVAENILDKLDCKYYEVFYISSLLNEPLQFEVKNLQMVLMSWQKF